MDEKTYVERVCVNCEACLPAVPQNACSAMPGVIPVPSEGFCTEYFRYAGTKRCGNCEVWEPPDHSSKKGNCLFFPDRQTPKNPEDRCAMWRPNIRRVEERPPNPIRPTPPPFK